MQCHSLLMWAAGRSFSQLKPFAVLPTTRVQSITWVHKVSLLPVMLQLPVMLIGPLTIGVTTNGGFLLPKWSHYLQLCWLKLTSWLVQAIKTFSSWCTLQANVLQFLKGSKALPGMRPNQCDHLGCIGLELVTIFWKFHPLDIVKNTREEVTFFFIWCTSVSH